MNDWIKKALGDVLPLIEQYAPSLATALWGPAAGGVISLLANTFNAPTADVAGIAKKMLQEPHLENVLKNLQNEHGWLQQACTLVPSAHPNSLELTLKINWPNDIT